MLTLYARDAPEEKVSEFLVFHTGQASEVGVISRAQYLTSQCEQGQPTSNATVRATGGSSSPNTGERVGAQPKEKRKKKCR